MTRTLTMSLVAALLMTSAAFAANPSDGRSFHEERYGKEIPLGGIVNRTQIHWTVNFHDFLDDQTNQLRIEIEKFKPVRFVREIPLSTEARGTLQVEPMHYPSVQFAAARW